MSLSAEQRKAIVEEYAQKDGDTGSSEVQIALLNARIGYLTTHMQSHRKDYHSRYGLIKLVGKQRRLLAYLRRKDRERYNALINKLGIRDRFAIRSS
jgi:small subunit ribosomal protein S15